MLNFPPGGRKCGASYRNRVASGVPGYRISPTTKNYCAFGRSSPGGPQCCGVSFNAKTRGGNKSEMKERPKKNPRWAFELISALKQNIGYCSPLFLFFFPPPFFTVVIFCRF